MPELRPHHDPAGVMASPPSPRAVLLWDGTYWRAARAHTDGTVQVRGEDQLHSFGGVLANLRESALVAAGGSANSASCPAGVIWHVTAVAAVDRTTATTAHRYQLTHGADRPIFYNPIQAFATSHRSSWHGDLWLDEDDYISVWFAGGLIGDTCRISIAGEIFTLET